MVDADTENECDSPLRMRAEACLERTYRNRFGYSAAVTGKCGFWRLSRSDAERSPVSWGSVGARRGSKGEVLIGAAF